MISESIYRAIRESFIEGAKEQARRLGVDIGEARQFDRDYFEKLWINSEARKTVIEVTTEGE